MTRDRYHCYGCGETGDLISFVKYIEGCSAFEAILILAKIPAMEYRAGDYDEYTNEEDEQYCIQVAKKIIENSSKPTGKVFEYLKRRGIKNRTIDKFNILQEEGDEYELVLPVLINNEIKGVCRRALTDIKPKYRYNYGFRKRKSLFLNVENKQLPVFLTEGLIDAYSAYQMGYPNVAAIFGGTPSNAQIKALSGRDVICATDPNEVGEKGYQILREKLDGRLLRFNFAGYEDTNDMLVRNEKIFLNRIHKIIRS